MPSPPARLESLGKLVNEGPGRCDGAFAVPIARSESPGG